MRVLLAASLRGITILVLVSGLPQTVINYSLPGPGGTITRHTAVYPPAVTASVVAGVVVLAAFAFAVLNVVRRTSTTLWLVVVGLLVADVVVLVVVSSLSRPVF